MDRDWFTPRHSTEVEPPKHRRRGKADDKPYYPPPSSLYTGSFAGAKHRSRVA